MNVLWRLLFIVYFLLSEVQAPIQFLNLDMHADARKLHCFAGAIMAIMPDLNVLLVALPDFNVLGKLADQYDLLDGWTLLIGFEFYSSIPHLCTG